jgi:hypothetical protein
LLKRRVRSSANISIKINRLMIRGPSAQRQTKKAGVAAGLVRVAMTDSAYLV